VEVCYPAGLALKKIDLEIAAGETVAIVGHTGSGKSTLVSLIPRLIDPTRGGVYLDGVNLRELDPEWLRRQIGFVPQETFLFSATLADNIAWGVEGASEAGIARAADLAGLGPDIAGFPAGYQTMIGERGLTLSGGQKQRVAIARAILRDPRILILDDALSSVDTLTEERILSRTRRCYARTHYHLNFAPRFHGPGRQPYFCDRAWRSGRTGHPRRIDSQRRILCGSVSEATAGRRIGSDLIWLGTSLAGMPYHSTEEP
jgi:ABC-type multidrug transport system fused ATPase/permease subunit